MEEVGEAGARRRPGRPAGRRDGAARLAPARRHRHAAGGARRSTGRRERTGDLVLARARLWLLARAHRPLAGDALVAAGHDDRAAGGGRRLGIRLGLSQARDGERPCHQRTAVPERDPAAAPRAPRAAPALRLDLRPHARDRRGATPRMPPTSTPTRRRPRCCCTSLPTRSAWSGPSTSRTGRVGRVLQYAMPAVTRSGVVGTPSTASAARGAELFGELVDALAGAARAGPGRARPRALSVSAPAGGRRSSSAGPGRGAAARSPGLASRQRSSDRQPQPMHSVSPASRRSSSAMRSSIRAAPAARQPRPVAARRARGRRAAWRARADLVERQPDALGEDDERDPAQHRARVAAVARAGALGARSGRAPRRSAAPRRRRRCAARPRRSSAARTR